VLAILNDNGYHLGLCFHAQKIELSKGYLCEPTITILKFGALVSMLAMGKA
jgi:hypothetical protein